MKFAALFLFTAFLIGNSSVSQAADYRLHSDAKPVVAPPLPISGSNLHGIIEPGLPEEPCFSYRYVEAGYVYRNSDPSWGGNGNGGGVKFSYDFLGPVYALGSYSTGSGDYDSKFSDADFGLGMYHQLFECFQLTFEAGGAWQKREIDVYSESDFGYFVGPGLRTRLKKGVEVFGNAYYSEVGETDGLVYGGGFVIDLMPNLFLNLSAQIDDNSETFLAGIRYVY